MCFLGYPFPKGQQEFPLMDLEIIIVWGQVQHHI